MAAACLATGVALLVHAVSGVSLLLAVALAVCVAVLLATLVLRKLLSSERAGLAAVIRAGAVAGLAATLAYDVSRFVLIELTGIRFWPFDIFGVFGRALLGAGQTGWWVQALGVGYHLANGVGFALSYALLFGRRGLWAGIAWALCLEALMVSVYPGWLGLAALDEFLQVSIFGHLVYGGVLGSLTRYSLLRGERDGPV